MIKKLRSSCSFALAALVILMLLPGVGRGQIISQYVETNTGSVPKGVEIWNNTGSTLDFSTNNLIIQQGTNGAALTDIVATKISTGTLASGAVLVIGTVDIGTYLTGQGLTSVTFLAYTFTFNGDDALAVKYGSTTTDIFGTPGVDPGTDWNGSSVSTMNQNIALKTGITTGASAWTDPSLRFSTISTTPATLPAGLSGFGVAPVSGPILSVTGTFSAFTTAVGTPSASQSLTVSGTNLTTTIELLALSGYEYSTTNAAPWTSSLSLASSFNGSVYARLTGTSLGNYNGNVSFTSTGATQVDKAVTGVVNPLTPVINVTGTFSAFSTIVGTPSASQPLTVSGSNLTSTIEVSAVPEFEYSTTDAAPWSTSLSLASSFSGTVHVRLTGASIGSPAGTISFTSAGATQVDKAVSGTVTAPPPVISVTGTFSTFAATIGTPSASQSVTVSGTNLIDGIGVSAVAGYEYSTDAITWTSTLSLASNYNGTVFVRLTGASLGSFGGTISFTSTGATQIDRVVNGTVSVPAPSLPLYENFNFTDNSLLTANGWVAHSGAASSPIAVGASNGLSYTGYSGVSGITGVVEGNAAKLITTGEDDSKIFNTVTSGSIYFSFLTNVTTGTAGYYIHLGASTSVFAARIYVKPSATPGKINFGISNTSTASYAATPADFDPDVTYLLIVKYDVSATGAASLWVKAAGVPSDETAAGTAECTTTGSGQASIDRICLRQYVATQSMVVDGIRVGTSWADIIPPVPAISVSSLTGFGNHCINSTSNANSFTITGTDLTAADVTVGALAGYTYSTTEGGSYTTSLTLTHSAGAYSQTVFVKFSPLAVQAYDGNIVIGGGGAASKDVAATGSGINTSPTVTTTDPASVIGTTTATCTGSVTNEGCQSVTESGICYGIASDPDITGTKTTSGFPGSLAGLTPNQTYHFRAYATSSAGTSYGDDFTFTTLTVPAATPTFNPVAGTYSSTQYVSITCASTGVAIYYTTDGTDPNDVDNGTLFTGTPITVSSNTTIKAIAYGTGYDPSAIASATYTITFPLTFNVDMSAASGFTPGVDVVYLAGSFTSWDQPGTNATMLMSQVGSSLIYTLTLQLPAGFYQYKYFKNASWTYGEWDGSPDRSVTLGGELIQNDVWATYLHQTDFTGAVSSDWNTAGNWTNGLPGTISDVTIPGGLTNNPTLTSFGVCHNLTIASGASLLDGNNYLNVTGTATVNRAISDATDDNWHLFISPIEEGTPASVGSCFEGAYVDGYNENIGAWERLVTDDDVTSGQGYSINYLTGSRDLVFEGTLMSSPVIYTDLSYTPSAVIDENYAAGWQLVGNPYPCGIDTKLLSPPTNMNAYAYVWDGISGNYNQYVIGSTPNDGIIAPLQGFFVKTLDASNDLTLDNAAKVHGGTFYKSSNSASQMLSLSIAGNNYSDKTYVRFNAEATANFDQSFDAYKRSGLDAAPQLYSILPGEKAAVNTLPDYTTNSNVALGLKVGASTSYTINVSGIESFDASLPIRLDDLKLGTSQDMRINPVYTFDAAAGDDENRFLLSFASVTAVNELNAAGIRVVSDNGIIRITHSLPATGTVYLYSVSGQLLASSTLNKGETTLRAASAGVYLVRVVTGKTSLTRKMVVVQ